VRSFVAIFLSVAFLALGTGALEFLHNLDHKAEDARLAADAAAACASGAQSDHHHQHLPPLHDDTNCETHALLHMPTIAAGWTPLLVFVGLFVAFLTLLASEPVSHRPLLRLDCRGPPAC
jgi:hypothetical protein